MGPRIVVLDCSLLGEADGEQLEAIASLCLRLKRRGCGLRLVNPSRGLLDLIELSGLGSVLTPLRVEVGGEAEERKETGGVEEEGELRDPTA